MKQVYIAGSLFKSGDIKERIEEGRQLREQGLKTFNPIEQPFNDDKSKKPTAHEIFKGDTNAIIDSDIIFAEYDGEDPGVMAELGITWAINDALDFFEKGGTIEEYKAKYKKKEVIVHSTDIRQGSAGEYDGHYVPYGLNQYVVGMIEDQGTIFTNKQKAIEKAGK
ncbi:nucleoside 2-deoxyribosyltransferase [Mycoplasma todarodis]|uniref:Nucleoside 2-deoxyribosyltransferase n=1 Tax=Mycoplasma todarodis TaxID=1937191 RepID=A0A4R0XLN4_9MOLU|nr:nucleoside 2-deoxyribosyltransferase [Mycoplasma todarodis]TCG11606.1 nucleoside 2-deoxyribosyltransferase [Mycoplasma todarodis]